MGKVRRMGKGAQRRAHHGRWQFQPFHFHAMGGFRGLPAILAQTQGETGLAHTALPHQHHLGIGVTRAAGGLGGYIRRGEIPDPQGFVA